jgi:two-component system, cell cycle sensor histidine kinase and response regulator CckA
MELVMLQNDERNRLSNPDLRQNAEGKLTEKKCSISNRSEIDLCALYHELEVHQVELEMQNEELLRVQAELAASVEKYRYLYELAPIGYLTIEGSGKIIEANLTAASLLGTERIPLINSRFQAYLLQQQRSRV